MHILSETINKHSECLKCALGTVRVTNKDKVVFLNGMFDSIGLVIIPKPIYNDSDRPAPYGASTEEIKIMEAIWKKAGLDADLWSITTAIGCRGEITQDNIQQCSERLSDIIYAISPKLIVTCGPAAAWAFTQKKPPQQYGFVSDPDVVNYKWLHTYDISDYLKVKSEDLQKASAIADAMMTHWQEASEFLKTL